MFIDVETTGLNPNRHSLIEIGAKFRGEFFYQKCPHDDALEIDPKAIKINGYDPDATDRKGWKLGQNELLEDFLNWYYEMGGHDNVKLCGCNVGFDSRFLNINLTRYDFGIDHWSFRLLDLHQFAYFFSLRWKEKISAGKVYQRLGIPKEGIPHTAINGVKQAIKIYEKIINVDL